MESGISAHSEPESGNAFSVTMVRPGPMPSFEIAAYEYVAHRLPYVGDTIVVRKVGTGQETLGYVTRVNPYADTPIAVTEVPHEPTTEDILA
jgi:hypothetical protein